MADYLSVTQFFRVGRDTQGYMAQGVFEIPDNLNGSSYGPISDVVEIPADGSIGAISPPVAVSLPATVLRIAATKGCAIGWGGENVSTTPVILPAGESLTLIVPAGMMDTFVVGVSNAPVL